jgi:predicted  nucleic acid-binding Zn-ribbon protein
MMNYPSFRSWTATGVVALAFLLCSCGDDPVLVKQRDEQKLAISKLEGELSMLAVQLENAPPDRSAELAQLKLDAEANRAQIEELEAAIDALEREKSAIEKEHAAFRRKYVTR